MNNLRHIAFLAALTGCFSLMASCGTTRQAASQNKETADLLESGRYTFKAQRFTTQGGFSRDLTTAYDLSISKDTIKAWLPYFGRAYQAPMDPSKGGIDFTSTDFNYAVQERGDKGWNVKIIPKDQREVDNLSLSVSKSGYATLNVISLNRQPISFYGKIVPRE